MADSSHEYFEAVDWEALKEAALKMKEQELSEKDRKINDEMQKLAAQSRREIGEQSQIQSREQLDIQALKRIVKDWEYKERECWLKKS